MALFTKDNCIDTYSGLELNFADPKVEQINIFDISKGLAYKAHFAGQTEHYFSIAQHSLLVLDLLPMDLKNDANYGMSALLHDASEAYTGDIPKPLKNMLPSFKLIEDRLTKVIFDKFDIDINYMKLVKRYDIEAQKIEWKTFFEKTNHLTYLSPDEAQSVFMNRYFHYKNMIDQKHCKQSIKFML